MASRWNYYLVKTARVSGWLLFVLVLIYIVTGFVLCSKLGFDRLIEIQTARNIHEVLDWPFVAIFVVHSLVTIYFAMRRWGWIKPRSKPTSP